MLKTAETKQAPAVAAIRIAPAVRIGEDVVTYGFPLTGTLSSSGNVTSGIISALAGMGDDIRFFQLTAPVQPGNSGGPLLDRYGNVIGLVTMKLDALKLAQRSSEFPQNVNFAIKANVAINFLEANGICYRQDQGVEKLDLPSVVDKAAGFTAFILCRR